MRARESDRRLSLLAALQNSSVKFVAATRVITGPIRAGASAVAGRQIFVAAATKVVSQADVAHDVFAVREARDGPEDEDRGECGQRPDAGMRQQQTRPWVGIGRGGDAIVQFVDPGGQPGEQLEIIVAASCRVRGQGQGVQLGQAALGPQGRAECQALIQGDACSPFLTIVRILTRRTR